MCLWGFGFSIAFALNLEGFKQKTNTEIVMVDTDQLSQQVCWICDQKCFMNTMKLHLILRHNIKEHHVCNNCGWVCSSPDAVNIHQLQEHKWCQHCDDKISHSGEIVHHLGSEHVIPLEARVMKVSHTCISLLPSSSRHPGSPRSIR